MNGFDWTIMPRTRNSRHIFALFPSLQEAILPGLCFTKFRLNPLSIYYLHLFVFPQPSHLGALCSRQLLLSNSQGKAHIHYFIDFFYWLIYIKLVLFSLYAIWLWVHYQNIFGFLHLVIVPILILCYREDIRRGLGGVFGSSVLCHLSQSARDRENNS